MKKENVNPERKHVSMINEYDLTSSKEKVQTLAQMQTEVPDTVKAHYLALNAHASECLQCGVCESRCPFAVDVRQNMLKAAKVFGR